MQPGIVLDRATRRAALGGIAGVTGFVGAWVLAGLSRDDYSAVDDAISRLAAADAPNRWAMTAGFVAFGIGVPIYSSALRRAVAGPAWLAAALSGVTTLGVAAAPLGAADAAHNITATVGYVALAATPLLAAPALRRRGDRVWATVSVLCGTSSAVLLTASSFDPAHGLTQRLGLGITDAWIVATAWAMWRHGRIGRATT